MSDAYDWWAEWDERHRKVVADVHQLFTAAANVAEAVGIDLTSLDQEQWSADEAAFGARALVAAKLLRELVEESDGFREAATFRIALENTDHGRKRMAAPGQ